VRIGRNATDLEITGEQTGLRLLADNLDAFTEAPASFGGHLHIESYPGHYFLAPDSGPLLIVIDAEQGEPPKGAADG
jgi:hypothetical protein